MISVTVRTAFCTALAVVSILSASSKIGGSIEPPIFLYFTGFFGILGACTASKTSAIFLPKIASKSGTTTCLTTFVTKMLYAIMVFDTFRFLFYAKWRRFSALRTAVLSFSVGFFFDYRGVISVLYLRYKLCFNFRKFFISNNTIIKHLLCFLYTC